MNWWRMSRPTARATWRSAGGPRCTSSAGPRCRAEAARCLGDGLTGFALAGGEAAFPDPRLHAEAFALARAAGLGITIHAGEWGGAAQVRRALALEPARIAHGAPAVDDPALMAELRARGITR